MKKLFLHWLANEKQQDEMLIAFDIAREAKFMEAIPIALKAINDTKKYAGYRAGLLLDYLAIVGGKEHLKDLAPTLLEDDSGLGSLTVGFGPTLAPQLRDVALAVSIRLAGQEPRDFGFHKSGFELENYHSYYGGYAFIDSAARKAAHAKWQAWLRLQDMPSKK
jgi:hypothetical protein